MKNSKRVLGVVLALIMIFNILAVGSFAAYTGGAAAKLIISTDKDTYAPGDEVTISFGVHSNETAGNFSSSGGWAYGYNTDVLEFCSTSDYNLSTGAALHNFVIDATQTGFVGPMSQIVPDAQVVGESITPGYDWDAIGFVSIAGSEGFVDTISNEYTFFSFKMKIKADAADGTYTIGYNPACYETWYAYNSTDVYGEGSYGDNGTGTDYDFGTCTFTVSSAPAVTVEAKDPMAHMNNWEDTEATTYTAGLVGQINGLALTFNETTGECDQIKEIKVTVEGSDKVGYAYKVYKVNDTTYQFRAILLDTPKTGTAALKYTFHVKLADGSTVTCSDETTAKEIFDAAYGRYQDSKKSA